MSSHTALLGPRRMAPSKIDDDDDEIVVVFSVQSIRLHRPAAVFSLFRRARMGVSRLGRRQKELRDLCSGVQNNMRDYFGVHGLPPIYDDADLERSFPLPRVLFQRIFDDAKDEPYFQKRIDAARQLQAHPLKKVVGAVLPLAYGGAADHAGEYVRTSGFIIREAVRHLKRFLLQRYQSTYLRTPMIDELRVILARIQERGLPACIESLNCFHW